MPSIILECPHCGAEKIGFDLAVEMSAAVGPPNTRRCYTLMTCSNCARPVTGIFDAGGNTGYPNGPKTCPSDPTKSGWALIATYPSPRLPKCPEYTPDDLKRIFLQAENALKRGDSDASGAMSRKVMDVSTQRLLQQIMEDEAETKKFKTIYDRIEALASKGALTPDLKDWAHQLRLGGADAAHDLDPFTIEEADELVDFAELYLTYVYALPGRLKARRERAAAGKAVNPSN